MGLKQDFLHGILWSAVQKWGNHTSSLVVFWLLARLIGPTEFGVVATAGVVIAFLRVFLDQGFTTALIQRRDIEDAHLDSAFWSNLSVGCCLAIACGLAAPIVSTIFDQPRLEAVIQVLSLTLVFGALSAVQGAILTRNFAFRVLAIRTLLANAVGGITGISLALAGSGVWALVAQQLASSASAVLILWMATKWHPRFSFSGRHFRELFKFGVNVLGFEMVNYFSRQTDRLLIGYFLGPTALGYYALAGQLVFSLVSLFTDTIASVALPAFSRLQGDFNRLSSVFLRAVKMSSLIAFPVLTGVALLAPDLIPGLFGDRWEPSAPVLQGLCVYGLILSIFWFNGTVLLATGHPGWLLLLGALAAVGNAVAFAAVWKWGIVAVAFAFAGRAILLAPVAYVVTQRILGFRTMDYVRVLVPALAASTVLAGTLGLLDLFAPTLPWAAFVLLSSFCGLLVYVSALYIVDRSSLSELAANTRQLLSVVSTARKR